MFPFYAQSTFTYLKLTIEIQYFTPCSSVSIVNFENKKNSGFLIFIGFMEREYWLKVG